MAFNAATMPELGELASAVQVLVVVTPLRDHAFGSSSALLFVDVDVSQRSQGSQLTSTIRCDNIWPHPLAMTRTCLV
jgi:hypothetical protein